MAKGPLRFDGWFRDAKDPERWHLILKTEESPFMPLCGAVLTKPHVIEANPDGRCGTCQDVMTRLKSTA